MTLQPSFLDPLRAPQSAPLVLLNRITGIVLSSTIELAGGVRHRRWGLAGRTGLPVGHALVLAPCGGTHTFGIRFPVDVVFVSADGRVRKVCREVAPRRVLLSLGSYAAIHLAAGSVPYSGALPGDLLEIVPVSRAAVAHQYLPALRRRPSAPPAKPH